MAIAEINGCSYCLSAHTYLGNNVAKLDDTKILANRDGTSSDSKAAAAVHVAQVNYRTANVDGLDVFYREAGAKDASVLLLLHGFPTSSHMFRNLIPKLAHKYHIIGPDYPGFGQSAMPDWTKFAYTFDNYAQVIDKLIRQLEVNRYALYMMDYGAPIGFHLAAKSPERLTALIVQNGNAYNEGLK